MNRCNLGYSLKNIPIPSRDSYLKKLILQTESFIKRLRWKVFWFERKDEEDFENNENIEKDYFGFKSNNTPPMHKSLANFEADLYDNN